MLNSMILALLTGWIHSPDNSSQGRLWRHCSGAAG